MPGGFVECNESVEQAIARELKEETDLSLEFTLEDQFRVYSHPLRDPRHHVVTVVFFKELKKKPELKPDNKEVREVRFLDYNSKKPILGFDHEFILKDFIKWYNDRKIH